VQAAINGADVVTCPLSAILGMLKHPLTDIGLEKFLADYKKVNG
jgi:transaldolase